MSKRLLFLLLSSPCVLGGCAYEPDANGYLPWPFADGLKRLPSRAFEGCATLRSITLPDSLTSLGDHAFKGCSSLLSITLPYGVTSIGG